MRRVTAFALYDGPEGELSRPRPRQGPGSGVRLILTPNLDHLRLLSRSSALRWAYRSADVVVNDSRFLDKAFFSGAATCAPGSDLAPKALARLPEGARVAVVGYNAAVMDYLRRSRPGLDFRFFDPSMGYVRRRDERRALAESLRALDPDYVFVCTGAPQSELFAAQLKRTGAVRGDILCCGAALHFLAGSKSRAPRWVQAIGAEWVWRYVLESHTRDRYAADIAFLLRNLPAFMTVRRNVGLRLAAFALTAAPSAPQDQRGAASWRRTTATISGA